MRCTSTGGVARRTSNSSVTSRRSRALIEKVYGHGLEFEDPGRERRAVRIAEYREGHISRNDEWGDYVDWFIDRGEAARRAIDAYLAAQ